MPFECTDVRNTNLRLKLQTAFLFFDGYCCFRNRYFLNKNNRKQKNNPCYLSVTNITTRCIRLSSECLIKFNVNYYPRWHSILTRYHKLSDENDNIPGIHNFIFCKCSQVE